VLVWVMDKTGKTGAFFNDFIQVLSKKMPIVTLSEALLQSPARPVCMWLPAPHFHRPVAMTRLIDISRNTHAFGREN
jgi:hypothetical protein